MGGGSVELDAVTIAMSLLGGLALFLYGMEQMADALKAVAGERMKSILARLTSNRLAGMGTGAFVTAVIQSSSVTTVLVVGFISAGLMTVPQSVGVILGANIGTTITAQVVAFKVTKYALLLVAAGYAATFLGKGEAIRQYGLATMGLGLIFFGMSVMGDAMVPLRSWQPFLDLMARMDNPLLAIGVAAAFTGLIQSSSAATGIIIVLATQGFITLPAGIALVFGTNVGTCVTALLASIGRPREARRAAFVHVLFNVLGVVLWVGFIDPFSVFITQFSPTAAHLEGADRLAAETPRQIANAHTVFNIANALIFLPFTGQIARFVEWAVPALPDDQAELVRARHLDADLIDTPGLALDRVRLELERMGRQLLAMLDLALPAVVSGTQVDLAELTAMDDKNDALYRHIIEYLGQISQKRLTKRQTAEFVALMQAANDLESIGDVIETNLATVGRRRLEANVTISPQTTEVLAAFHSTVRTALETAAFAVSERDTEAARAVIEMKQRINEEAQAAFAHEALRLVGPEPNRLPSYSVEIDIIENLKRVYYYCKRAARGVGGLDAN